MKKIDEIRKIPNIQLYLHGEKQGIAKFKLKSTKHMFKTRVVFSWHSGMDVIMIMFKANKRATPEEIAEVKELFLLPEEIPQCEVMQHPDDERVAVIYRMHEVINDGS